MGTQFHRLVMAAMAAGLLVIPGCGAADGKSPAPTVQEPPATTTAVQPKVVSAAIDSTGNLKVSFSEAMAPATNVDPAKFRLTVAYYTGIGTASGKYNYAYANKYTYTGGSAKQPAAGGGKYYYGSGNYKYSGYGSPNHTEYNQVGGITAIKVDPATGAFAELALDSTFDLATECQEIAAHNKANPNSHAGLYLHYTQSGSPTLEDTQGNKLASLAAYWSADPTLEQVSGDFAGKPIPVSITCP
jgi:hypothetical protein